MGWCIMGEGCARDEGGLGVSRAPLSRTRHDIAFVGAWDGRMQ